MKFIKEFTHGDIRIRMVKTEPDEPRTSTPYHIEIYWRGAEVTQRTQYLQSDRDAHIAYNAMVEVMYVANIKSGY